MKQKNNLGTCHPETSLEYVKKEPILDKKKTFPADKFVCSFRIFMNINSQFKY